MQTMRELMTPTAHWVISEAEGGTLVFSSAEGRSVRYVTDNKKEKHQLAGGTIETKTKWDNGQLRQEIDLATGMKAVRVFAVTPGEMFAIDCDDHTGGRGGRARRTTTAGTVSLRPRRTVTTTLLYVPLTNRDLAVAAIMVTFHRDDAVETAGHLGHSRTPDGDAALRSSTMTGN